jgi:hypothetical protein
MDKIEVDENEKNNPLVQHGSGIRCYFVLMEMLLKQQCMISAIACIMMFLFMGNTGLIEIINSDFFIVASYGNMGF